MTDEVEAVARALRRHWIEHIGKITMVGFTAEQIEGVADNLEPWDDYASAAIAALTALGWQKVEKDMEIKFKEKPKSMADAPSTTQTIKSRVFE